MRNSSSLDWLRFMHTPNDYRVSLVYTNANHISIRLNICQIQCGKVQHIKKNSLNLQKIEAIEISFKKFFYSHSIVALGFGDIS